MGNGLTSKLAYCVADIFERNISDANSEEIAAEYQAKYSNRISTITVRMLLPKVREILEAWGYSVYLVNDLYFLEPTEEAWGAGRQIPDSEGRAYECIPKWERAEGICQVTTEDDLIWQASWLWAQMSGVGKINKVNIRMNRGIDAGLISERTQKLTALNLVRLFDNIPPGIKVMIGNLLLKNPPNDKLK